MKSETPDSKSETQPKLGQDPLCLRRQNTDLSGPLWELFRPGWSAGRFFGFEGLGSAGQILGLGGLALGLICGVPRAVGAPPPGFTALFNGKDLTGWWGAETEDPRKYMA